MKKTLFLFLIALSVISCQGPVGPEGPQGYGTNWKIINLVANSSDWVENVDPAGLNRYYSTHFSMPEIDSNVFNNGTVLSYIMINNSTQENLPYVRHFQNAAGAFWTQTIDYDYSVGSLNVYVTNSDFVSDPPATMNFRVVLMW